MTVGPSDLIEPYEREVNECGDEPECSFDQWSPGLGWFDCPILDPADMLARIKGRKSLDGRSINLFSALERPRASGLVQLYLRDNLYQPGSHYIYTTPDPVHFRYKSYRPVVTKAVVEANTIGPCALFTNTLAWGQTPPSERSHNAGFTVYTVEFDHTSIDEQLQIIWSGRL